MPYSHSGLSSFEQCPRKFAFHYVEKPELEEEFESVEAFLGTRVHEALERLYDFHRRGRLLSPKELLEFYRGEWERAWSPAVRIVRKGLKPGHYEAKGETFLTEYYARHEDELTSGNLKTVGLERNVSFPIQGRDKGYHITGFIDRLSYDSDANAYQVHDYKTNASLPPQERLDSNHDEGRQLGLYDLGVRFSWPDAKDVSLHWHFLAFDKEMTSRRTKEQRAKLEGETAKLIEKIETAKEEDRFPTRTSELCNYCSYQEICPAWKHRLKVEGEPLERFLKEPGVKLVNEYAKVKKELDAYTAEKEAILEELKAALLAYAKKHGVESIRGTNTLAIVASYSRKEFTSEESPEYGRLVEALKKADQFEDFAKLSASQLYNAMESGELDPKAEDALKKVLVIKKTEQLRLKQIAEGEK